MVRLTVVRARRMTTLVAARQHLGKPPRPVLRKALRGLAAESRLMPGARKIGVPKWV